MQFKTKILSLSGILLALIILYILGTVYSKESIQQRSENQFLLSNFDGSNIGKIVFNGKERSTILQLNMEKQWDILIGEKPFPADVKKVEAFIEKISTIHRVRVVSKDPETWKNFNVDNDAQTMIFKDKSGKLIETLFIGMEGIQGAGTYIRFDGTDDVILTDFSLSSYFTRKGEFWSKLDLFSSDEFEFEDVSTMSVKADIALDQKSSERIKADYTLIKTVEEKGDAWHLLKDNHEVDQTMVKTLVNSFTNIKAGSYVTDADREQAGLLTPEAEITVNTSENRSYSLKIGKTAKEAEYYLGVSNSPYVYTISLWALKGIIKPLDEIYADK